MKPFDYIMAFLMGLVLTALIIVLNSCAGVTVKGQYGDYDLDKNGHFTIKPKYAIIIHPDK